MSEFLKNLSLKNSGATTGQYSPVGSGDTSAIAGSTGSMFDWFGNSDNLAATGAILGGIGGIGGLWTGLKQLDLQKDMFNFQKQFAQAEYSNQAKLTNERLATRYATRQAENPERFNLALGDYMKKYGAQEKVGG